MRSPIRPLLLGTAVLIGPVVVGSVLHGKAVGRTLEPARSTPIPPPSTFEAHPASAVALPAEARGTTLTGVLADLSDEAGKQVANVGPMSSAADSPRLTPMQIGDLARRCAPTTPVSIVVSLIAAESGGRPWVLATNGPHRSRYFPASREVAVRQMEALQARGVNVDVGLMQINSATLRRLHTPASEALDACRNVALGARVFDEGYAIAFGRQRATLPLLSAYSVYNTGDPERGVRNGYADQAAGQLRSSSLTHVTG